MRRALVILCFLLLLAPPWVRSLGGQAADACAVVPPGTVFTLLGAAAPLILWTMPSTMPVSSSDPTLVPARYDGFYVQIDALPRIDTGTLPSSACSSGEWGYSFRWPTSITRGSHVASVQGWNFALDAGGNPTTTRQEGAITTAPFVVADPLPTGAPSAPRNVKVVK